MPLKNYCDDKESLHTSISLMR